MGLSWKKFGGFALKAVTLLLPAFRKTEQDAKSKVLVGSDKPSGGEKEEQSVQTFAAALELLEAGLGKDILNDAAAQACMRQIFRATADLQNIIARAKHLRDPDAAEDVVMPFEGLDALFNPPPAPSSPQADGSGDSAVPTGQPASAGSTPGGTPTQPSSGLTEGSESSAGPSTTSPSSETSGTPAPVTLSEGGAVAPVEAVGSAQPQTANPDAEKPFD